MYGGFRRSGELSRMKKTDTERLVVQCLRLKGGSLEVSEHSYGPSLCARCKRPIKPDGQEALNAVATSDGVYFRIKVPCVCGSRTGYLSIDRDEVA